MTRAALGPQESSTRGHPAGSFALGDASDTRGQPPCWTEHRLGRFAPYARRTAPGPKRGLGQSRGVSEEFFPERNRWPRFIPRAVELGLRSQIGLRLYVENQTLGGLNLYSTATDTINPEVLATAELFAAHAALALGKAQREDNLHSALFTRKVIGQAIGLIMERYEFDEDQAFLYLARVSQHSNHKLRDVAAELVQQATERNRPPHVELTFGAPNPDGHATTDPSVVSH